LCRITYEVNLLTLDSRIKVFVLLLPYLEEGNRYAGFEPTKSVMSKTNLPTTSGTVSTYICPSMSLPRDVPATDCGEQFGPGSYIISTRTEYDSYKVAVGELDGAFTRPAPGIAYRLSFRQFVDGTSKTLLVGETNYGLVDWRWKADDCAALADQTKWGDQKWAEGYWAYAWGHIDWDLYRQVGISSYNADALHRTPETQRVFRSDHPGGAQFVFVDGSVHFIPDTVNYPVLRALVTRAGGETDYNFD